MMDEKQILADYVSNKIAFQFQEFIALTKPVIRNANNSVFITRDMLIKLLDMHPQDSNEFIHQTLKLYSKLITAMDERINLVVEREGDEFTIFRKE
jgi:5-methylcytosine-specific restriction endonuclease McrBC GTP-binding regulatory subunit McrB